jgi:hemolysin activation/secretion protein
MCWHRVPLIHHQREKFRFSDTARHGQYYSPRSVTLDRCQRLLRFSLVMVAVMWMWSAAAQVSDLASTPTILVREIRIEGDPLLSQSVQDEFLPAYRGRAVTADDLLRLTQQLTARLVDQGYVNSGVILPDQKLENGIVYLRVIAGRVTSVVVNGNKNLDDVYIAEKVSGPAGEPFNINAAVHRLQMLERNPRIRKLSAELKPSVERGTAVLNVDVEEARLYGGSAGVDNHLSPNVGGVQAFVDFYHLSVAGIGDALTLNYRKAEGFQSGLGAYAIPLNANDTTVVLNYDFNTSRIVTEPFEQLDIEGKTSRYGILLRHPFVSSLATEFSAGVGVHHERVASYLLGEPFSFSASDPNGLSQVTLVQIMQDWVNRSPERVFALRSSISVGVDALGATVGAEGDGEFIELLVQAEWLQLIDWLNSTLDVQTQVHVSNDTLPAYRKYPLGGADSVRGYRENLLVRDNAFLASIEWTVPIAHLPVRWLSQGPADGQISLIPFIDYGYGWDYVETLNEPADLASIGLGVQWRIGKNSLVDLQFAKALISNYVAVGEQVLQDDGVHFSVRVGF